MKVLYCAIGFCKETNPGRLSRIRHRNALTERVWKDAVQGLGKYQSIFSTVVIEGLVTLLLLEKTGDCAKKPGCYENQDPRKLRP